jgi:cerevisin
MSLGGGKTKTLDDTVNAAVSVGIHFAVAAGNDNADACNYSPAAAAKAVTVGASAIDDSRAYFSNYGKCTDIFAPGLSGGQGRQGEEVQGLRRQHVARRRQDPGS